MVFAKELKKPDGCSSSGYHFPLPAPDRIESLLDKGHLRSMTKILSHRIHSILKGSRLTKRNLSKTEQRRSLRMRWLAESVRSGGMM